MTFYEFAVLLGFAGYYELLLQSELIAEVNGFKVYSTPLPCGGIAVWSEKDTRDYRVFPSEKRARNFARKKFIKQLAVQ